MTDQLLADSINLFHMNVLINHTSIIFIGIPADEHSVVIQPRVQQQLLDMSGE